MSNGQKRTPEELQRDIDFLMRQRNYCQWCGNDISTTHERSCPVSQSEELEERVEELGEELDAVKSALMHSCEAHRKVRHLVFSLLDELDSAGNAPRLEYWLDGAHGQTEDSIDEITEEALEAASQALAPRVGTP